MGTEPVSFILFMMMVYCFLAAAYQLGKMSVHVENLQKILEEKK